MDAMTTQPLTRPPLDRGADGRLHPADEAEVAALVRFAAADGRRLRVRGAGHAPAASAAGDDPRDLVLSLDRMRTLTVVDEAQRIVEVQAGIHLGRDPASGPAGTLEASLLWQLADRHGWTLSSTGGITHQTLGGYLATTSAGGTLRYSMLDHVIALRLIDGRGEVHVISDSGDGPGLAAVLPSLGLLGVITSVTLRCEPLFTISGQEAIVDLPHAAIDLDGPGAPGRPSLARFLADAEYSRIEWWPQRGAERLLIWQAQRMVPQPGFQPARYEEFTAYPVLAQAIIGSLYAIFGNLAQPARAAALLRRNARHVHWLISQLDAAALLTPNGRRVARVAPILLHGLARALPLLSPWRRVLERSLPRLRPAVLDVVLPLDEGKPGMRRGQPQSFRDWGWSGLPMDNQASDVLLGSAFNEMWVPIDRAAELVRTVRAYFAHPQRARDAYRRSGIFAYELYGAPPAAGWLHPGYSDGEDEWRNGTVRLDVYWFSDNAEDPRERFFPQFWELLRDHDIPFRLHWGKQTPASSPGDRRWLDLIAARYPHWEDFLALRARLDPDEVFLTDYWRDRLGLWRAPAD